MYFFYKDNKNRLKYSNSIKDSEAVHWIEKVADKAYHKCKKGKLEYIEDLELLRDMVTDYLRLKGR